MTTTSGPPAEVTDVVNAVVEGTDADAVGETAVGCPSAPSR